VEEKTDMDPQIEIINTSQIKAAIFDMDGTMIDNMTYHEKAWIEFCNRHKLSFNSRAI
jgi:beta-phosphoglucomutase-like phosphatase (HAD superfamily)